jgi:hypothetical protein
MKLITLIGAITTTTFFFAQEIKVTEENVSFSNGSHNAIVVTIPHGNRDVVEKELKSELKDWGGKYSSSKGEMTTSQSSMKAMGDKLFDGYAKIMDGGQNYIKVAFAVDLGGAYLDSKQHGSQYSAIKSRAEKFASRAAMQSIEDELAAEAKVLKSMEKEKVEMEKTIEASKKDIEDYKKRIAEAEQKIKDNEAGVVKKTEEISTQTTKIGDVEKKKKSVN